jgi:hypothetical protein
VYEDGPDEVVLRVDAPVQLVGVGLAGSDAGYTAELEVLQVAEDFSEEVGRGGGGSRPAGAAAGAAHVVTVEECDGGARMLRLLLLGDFQCDCTGLQ